MGLEYSTCIELNQWEAQNHAANMKLWLHDNVDSTIVPSIVSFETLLKAIDSYFTITGITGIAYKADQAYTLSMSLDNDLNDLEDEFEAHNHDALYAALSHNHDTDYASLTEAAKHLTFSSASWVGAVTTPTRRQINLSGDTGAAKFLLIVGGYNPSTNSFGFVSCWDPSLGTNILLFSHGWSTDFYGIKEDYFYADPGETDGILDLYHNYLHQLNLHYHAFVWGVSS